MATTLASRTLDAAGGVDVGGALSDTLRSVLLIVPKLVLFAAILVVGWLLSRLLLTAVDKLLDRIGFDRAVERGGIDKLLARSRYDASDIVTRLVYYTGLLVTAQLAFGVWGPNPVSDLIAGILGWLPKLGLAVVIMVVTCAIARAARDITSAALSGLSYGRAIGTGTSWTIIGLGTIAALNQIGVAASITTPILITVLATVGGILVVGAGGGLIRPMQHRWEMMLTRAERESATIANRSWAYAAGRHAATAAFDEQAASAAFDEHAASAIFEERSTGTDSDTRHPMAFDDSPAHESGYIASYTGTGYPEASDYPSGHRVPFADGTPTEPLPAFIGLAPSQTYAQPERPAPPRFGDGSSAPMG